jgi:hypothetical protein
MAYYRTCPDCGCALDPGEFCDCAEKSEQLRIKYEQLTAVTKNGQIKLTSDQQKEISDYENLYSRTNNRNI